MQPRKFVIVRIDRPLFHHVEAVGFTIDIVAPIAGQSGLCFYGWRRLAAARRSSWLGGRWRKDSRSTRRGRRRHERHSGGAIVMPALRFIGLHNAGKPEGISRRLD